ncbi:MAG TPA: hypothetical protein VFV19_10345 [Candidatus Polarisedimenticolaceae bacterium]|nr:hypothetical protein [Candidatus Polarisedimenticolaceae bacterium]
MTESRAAAPYRNRRLQRRYNLAPDAGATLRFRYPAPAGVPYDLPLRDISLSGLSLVLPNDFPELQAGDMIKGIEVRVSRKVFHGDLLVMHVTPLHQVGGVCGGLFYPEGDEDLITVRLVIKALDAANPGEGGTR